jgi:hypothetical protein
MANYLHIGDGFFVGPQCNLTWIQAMHMRSLGAFTGACLIL